MITKSKTQTQKIAAKLAKKILKAKSQKLKAQVIALQGDLGAGKTTFVQGFMKALGVKQHVTSPTFLIVRKYEISTPLKKGMRHFHHAYHLDLYRIHRPEEISDIGWKQIIDDPYAIALIEWPERIKKLIPNHAIWIRFAHGKNKSERSILIEK